jgi:hypothetical protein
MNDQPQDGDYVNAPVYYYIITNQWTLPLTVPGADGKSVTFEPGVPQQFTELQLYDALGDYGVYMMNAAINTGNLTYEYKTLNNYSTWPITVPVNPLIATPLGQAILRSVVLSDVAKVLTNNVGDSLVSSVTLKAPQQFLVNNPTITTAGTIEVKWGLAGRSMVLAGPASGSPGDPDFRFLVPDDIPGIDTSKVTSGIFPPGRLGTMPDVMDGRVVLKGDSSWGTLDASVITSGNFAPERLGNGDPKSADAVLRGDGSWGTIEGPKAGPDILGLIKGAIGIAGTLTGTSTITQFFNFGIDVFIALDKAGVIDANVSHMEALSAELKSKEADGTYPPVTLDEFLTKLPQLMALVNNPPSTTQA